MFQTIFCTEKDCGNEHGVICLLHHNAGALQLNEIKHCPLKEKNSSLAYKGHFHKKVIVMKRRHLPGRSTLVIGCKTQNTLNIYFYTTYCIIISRVAVTYILHIHYKTTLRSTENKQKEPVYTYTL